MHDSEISATHEMYLKALFRLAQTRPVGRVRDLAETLGVTPGTVSTVLNRLQALGLVERERYGGAQLTPAGATAAECVTHRFETLQALLIELLGVDPEEAAREACRMEHAVSPATIDRMAAVLTRLRNGEPIDRASLERIHQVKPA